MSRLQRSAKLLNVLLAKWRPSGIFYSQPIEATEFNLASQAAYEGSIPFARSNHLFNQLDPNGASLPPDGFTYRFTGAVPDAFRQ